MIRYPHHTKAIVAFLFLAALFMTAGDAFAGQQGDALKTRKRLRALEKRQESVKKKISSLESQLAAKKKRLQEFHEAAFDFNTQKTVGTEIAAWFNANSGVDDVDKAYEANKAVLRKAFGREIVEAAKKDGIFDSIFEAIFDAQKKDKKPVDFKQIGRPLNDSFEVMLGRDYDLAFDKVLKVRTPEYNRLTNEQDELKKIGIQLDTIRRQQTATISARIPPSMVPVPKAQDVSVGITHEQIEKISTELGDEPKRNNLLLWATPPRKVTIDEFMIDQFEVSHLAYWHFCTETGRDMPEALVRYENLPAVDENGKPKKKAVYDPVWPDGKVPEAMKRMPMTYISYEDMVDYCLWTNSRLPTEFEWEVAARSSANGFDGRIWPIGPYEKSAFCDGSSLDDEKRRKHLEKLPSNHPLPGATPVGTFTEGMNPIGIYDMAGSVAEMTASMFKAYPGYEGKVKTKHGELDAPNHFNGNYHVLRGGHCDNRDVIVSTVFRGYMKPSRRGLKFVGFRRVRSGIAGKDKLEHLMRNGRLDARLQDFKLTRAEDKAKRFFPGLDTRPDYYDIAERFDWNDELKVRGKGWSILIANRATDELSSDKWAMRFSKGDNDLNDSFLVGMFHTEVDIMDPPLKAGTWFVSIKKGRKFRDPETKKKKTLKDAVLFVPFKSGEPVVRVDYKGTEITVQPKKTAATFKTQVTPIVVEGDAMSYDKLELQWVFDIGRSGKKAIVEIPMKVKKGGLNGFN